MFIIADELQITKIKIQKALKERDRDTIQELVKKSVSNGADAIDINTGPLGKEAEEKMRFFVNSVEEVTDLPVVIDTANHEAMEAGLECAKNRTIINGFSLEPNKLEKILTLCLKFDSDIMGYLLTKESHVPKSIQDRIAIALELHQNLLDLGIDEKRLIIDPVLSPLIWDDGKEQNIDLLEIIRILPEVLGFKVRTVVGLSNLTSGIKKDERSRIVESTFLAMMASSGLDMVLLNSDERETVKTAKTIKKLIQPGIFAINDIF